MSDHPPKYFVVNVTLFRSRYSSVSTHRTLTHTRVLTYIYVHVRPFRDVGRPVDLSERSLPLRIPYSRFPILFLFENQLYLSSPIPSLLPVMSGTSDTLGSVLRSSSHHTRPFYSSSKDSDLVRPPPSSVLLFSPSPTVLGRCPPKDYETCRRK